MKTYINYDLYNHNTMHLHCVANDVYVPENEQELVDLIKNLLAEKKSFHILGACSNIILPKKLKTPTILLTTFNKNLNIQDDVIEVGASVRIQHLIREAQKKGLGGIEYLFSVPCTVGGATVMNAGRGNGNQSLGNFVETIRCFNIENGKIELLNHDKCDFSFRHSIFQNGKRIVLSSILRLEKQDPQTIETAINERKKYALEKLDDRRPSCGSIFNLSNGQIMKRLKGLRIGGAEWSPKTNNWISNTGSAKNWHVFTLIIVACFFHRITLKKYHLEVEIWKK